MDVAKHKKVAVGMSGGVDSSVAALLLKDRGYEVTGVFMQCWDVKDDGCAADEDKAYALQTAMALDIPFKTLDFRNEYKERVIDYFYTEYENRNGEFKLLKGVDGGKDQSYFLYRLGQEQLGHTIFPLGELHKPEVRKLAKDKMLPSYKRPESMGICFIGEVDIKDFLGKRIDEKKGKVITSTGEEIGDHDGVWFLTIGQRHGFRLKKYFGDPMYVIAKDAGTNTLTVGSYEEALRDKFAVSELSWVGANPFDNADEITCDVRIRHLGKLTPGVVKKSGEQTSDVSLSSKLFGVAPGQSAVFYKGDEVLGGGIIG
ncbi:MAG: tRNA-specific 2-thiouridylase MnmA, tRNA-specific 2-thiouridylase [candidate division WWE3 bacterium GW2011_GWC1_42_102]|nr:MAG: tRNA-specific 2-thiouridylase MnmA, tRNA-specific 2-thiouridylase [candidate division WWE3 bacterium GW2011_GWC1_42_102]